jgi:hypothetical protein
MRPRTPTTFQAIPAAERIRWGLGQVLVGGEYVGVESGADVAQPPTIWPSWQAWAQTYARCREAYLAWWAQRFPDREPGAEALYRAYERGENPGSLVTDRGPGPRGRGLS